MVIAGALGAIEAISRAESERPRLSSPIATGFGGLVVVAYVLANHFRHSVFPREAFDLAHWLIATALVGSAALVGLGRLARQPLHLTELAAPFSSLILSAVFLVHGERTGVEFSLHVAVAATLVVSAVAHLSVILTGDGSRSLRTFAALLLAVGGLLLILYDTQVSPKQGASSGTRTEHE